MQAPVITTTIPGLPVHASGKVRDIFDLGDELLIVTSDRISAFDFVMPNGIPDKGRVLTQLSRHWFRRLRPTVSTHYITTDTDYIALRLREQGIEVDDGLLATLNGRSMLVVKADIIPIECVVRGYLAGSLWTEYCQAEGPSRGAVIHGLALPEGLRESDKLPEPVFTPATKASDGHDINIGMAEMSSAVGGGLAEQLASISKDIYSRAAARALHLGVIIADTKFEFGMHNGTLTLADEVLTPDSSRFWDATTYAPGKSQASFDKQFLRDWLVASGWNKEPPTPELPADVVIQTASRYREAFGRITGAPLPAIA